MLRSLSLRNLATISDTTLEFQGGLNVLTGETGSGKSILVDGLMLATGKRADRSMVRPGTRTASIEAIFQNPSGEETVIRREINLQGKSRVFIDDSLTGLDEVRDAVQKYVELHSQRSSPALMKPSAQLEMLDRYAKVEDLRRRFTDDFNRLAESLAEIERLREFLGRSSGNREVLLYEMNLFNDLQPSEDDYYSLISREKELRLAAEHSVLFGRSEDALQCEDGILSGLAGVLGRIRKESPESTAIIELLEQALIAVQEASSLISAEISLGEDAPARMAEIDERLERYSKLISRFGGTPGSMLDAGEKLAGRLQEFDNAEERIAVLGKVVEELSQGLSLMADELTRKRKESAKRLSESALDEMRRLNMPCAEFSVDFRPPLRGIDVGGRLLDSRGAESVCFLFSANRGIPVDSLESMASGGELSRVALALALVLADSGSATTLVFDEIDSGTGGETAHSLAESLLRASVSRQIIVISHLAQIASRAHRHMAVEKKYSDGMPVTTVNHLDSMEKRLEETARLLGGGEGARAHALRLLEGTG